MFKTIAKNKSSNYFALFFLRSSPDTPIVAKTNINKVKYISLWFSTAVFTLESIFLLFRILNISFFKLREIFI